MPFGEEVWCWRIAKLNAAQAVAQVMPYVAAAALRKRLDEVLGLGAWQLELYGVLEGVACKLSLEHVQRTALVSPAPYETLSETADVAFAEAAAQLGIGLSVGARQARAELPWVAFDPESGELLEPPLFELAGASRPNVAEAAAAPLPHRQKPEGQQTIDKLIERLRDEGQGLAVAKLITQFGGYGSDAIAARELYGKLRELLLHPSGQR